MAGIPDFINLVNQLGAAAQSGQQSLSELEASLTQLQGIQGQAAGNTAATEAWAKAVGQVSGQIKKVTSEQEKQLKYVKDTTKEYGATAGVLAKVVSQHEALNNKAKDLAAAWGSLQKGDLGRFLQGVTAGIPVVGSLGAVFGEVLQATVKAADAQVLLRKAIIDGQAAAGRFGEAMRGQVQERIADINQELADFGVTTGISVGKLSGYVGDLGKMGFSLEEMGIDERTGEFTSLTDSLDDASKGFGVLSAGIGLARLTGQDTTQVFRAMQFQMKEMGDTAEETVKTMAAISIATRQAGVSADVLAPTIRRMQEQFKFLGLDSATAALQMGDMAEASKRIGLGPQAGVQLMAQAAGGLAQQNFGMQAFLGQQIGTGGGLAAGFRFRQQVGESPLEATRGVVEAIQGMFGGRFIGVDEARRDEGAAAMRLAQEQMAMKTFGLNQLQAARLLDATNELKNLTSAGKGDSKRAKELQDVIEKAQMSEKDYAAKTLTMQERIAKHMELLYKVMSKAMLAFLKSMGVTGIDALNELLSSLGEGVIPEDFDEKLKGIVLNMGDGLNRFADQAGGFFGEISRLAARNPLMTTGIVAALIGFRTQITKTGLEVGIFATKHLAKATLKLAGFAARAAMAHPVFAGLVVAGGALIKVSRELAAARKKELDGMMQSATASNNLYKATQQSIEAKRKELNISEEASRKLLTSFLKGGEKEKKAFLSTLSGGEKELLEKLVIQAREKQAGSFDERSSLTEAAKGIRNADIKNMSESLMLLRNTAEIQARDAALRQRKPVKDAWDISKAGWLFASPGDVVIDANSLGQAMNSGERGAGVGALLDGVSTKATGSIFGAGAATRATGVREIPIKVILDIVEDKLGLFVNKQIAVNVDQDNIQPGKRGAAQAEQNSHSRSNELGS